MPLYEYEHCGKRFEKFLPMVKSGEPQDCPICGKSSQKVISLPAVSTFKPRYYENIDVEPIWIESKRQLKEECAKRELIADV